MKEITNIDLMSIKSYRFPITAISSILHRISGVILIFAIPMSVIAMNYSLAGPNGYKQTVNFLTNGCLVFCFGCFYLLLLIMFMQVLDIWLWI